MEHYQGIRSANNGGLPPFPILSPDPQLLNPIFKTPPASGPPSAAINPPWLGNQTSKPYGSQPPSRQNSTYESSYEMLAPQSNSPCAPSSPVYRQNSNADYGNSGQSSPRYGGVSVLPPMNRQMSSVSNDEPNGVRTYESNVAPIQPNNGPVTDGPPAPPPPPTSIPPPPPPPPPMPGTPGATPNWREKQQGTRPNESSGYHPSQNAARTPQEGSTQPFCYLPPQLASAMNKDKKPFTYTPGGIDLSEIRSPRMVRRISANQQQFPLTQDENNGPPRQVIQADVHSSDNGSPRGMGSPAIGRMQPVLPPFDPSQAARQLEGLNLHRGGGGNTPCSPLAYGPQDGFNSLPRNYQQLKTQYDPNQERAFPQSKSFKLLQMVTGTDAEKDQEESDRPKKLQEDEMRFTGLRRDHIPSRSFQTLQKMTGSENVPSEPIRHQNPNYYQEPQYEQQHHKRPSEGPSEEGPVDIRYVGGNIPSRSFKMLQEMTETGVPPPTVWSPQGHQSPVRKTSRVQVQMHPSRPNPGTPEPQLPPRYFPQPDVPASLQQNDPEPRKYTGGRIPSQSFKILQAMTGESPPPHDMDGTDF